LIDVLQLLTASIIIFIDLMMEAVSTSETSVNFYETTRHNIPEDSHLHAANGQQIIRKSKHTGTTALKQGLRQVSIQY
jgi:hypothetical protein